MWVSDLRSFDKLREVGDLSYLSFTLYLSVFMMFELIEALNGRLIGPKNGTELFEFMEPKFGVCGCHGLLGG